MFSVGYRLPLLCAVLSLSIQFKTSGASTSPDSSNLSWDQRFHLREVNGPVSALLADGTNLYVAGAFTLAGNVRANGIVRWDESTWAALGDGLGGRNGLFDAKALVKVNGEIFAGGYFTSAGGAAATNVARWNGTNWLAVGDGFSEGVVWSLANMGGEVYAGGSFTNVAGISANHVARWDGVRWFPLPAGPTNGYVLGLTTYGGSLYVGGTFTSVITSKGVRPCGIARWDGNEWSAIGTPFNATVWALRWHHEQLFVGGDFTPEDSQPARYIALWTGTQWRAVGDSTRWGIASVSGVVAALGAYDGYLIAAGNILDAGIQGFARWNGTNWSGFGNAFTSPFRGSAVAEFNGRLYAGDNYRLYGGGSSGDPRPLARWTGAAWEPVQSEPGHGIRGTVYAVAASGRDAYVAGSFNMAGAVAATNVARWDGSNWNPLGAGLASPVAALGVANPWVYAGNTDGVWRWDGTNWILLPGLYYVTALAAHGTNVYANHLAHFIDADGRGIMTWNGAEWIGLGGGLTMPFGFEFYHPVHSIAVSGDDVYICGQFTAVGGVRATNVARWNGTTWSALSPGLSTPSDIAIGPESVYAIDGQNVCKWDGLQWTPLENLFGQIEALAIVDGEPVVAGSVRAELAAEPRQLRRWNGTNWLPFGPDESGSGTVTTIALSGANVVVGGSFASLGQTAASNFGIGYMLPSLRLERLGAQLRLSWPTQAVDFVLQSATTFHASDWHSVSQLPHKGQSQFSIVLDSSDPRRYFRLRRQ
jgi:hypothetical protein